MFDPYDPPGYVSEEPICSAQQYGGDLSLENCRNALLNIHSDLRPGLLTFGDRGSGGWLAAFLKEVLDLEESLDI